MSFTQKHTGILVALVISIGMVGSAYILGGYTTPTVTQSVFADTSNDLIQAIADTDTDGDGLKDWEETLWGTDSTKVDTDGDGISDPASVKIRQEKAEEEGVDIVEELSLTSKFSRKFLTEYLSARQQYGSVSGTTQDFVIQQALTAGQPKTRALLDTTNLSVVPTTEASLLSYTISIAQAFTPKNKDAFKENEVTLLQRAISTQDPAIVFSFEAIAREYATLVKNLALVQVPDTLLIEHKVLMEASYNFGLTIEDFAQFSTNPLITVYAVKQYDTDRRAIMSAFVGLRAGLERAGVRVSESPLSGLPTQ